MKGWPLLRAFLSLAALLLAGLPLRHLTALKEQVIMVTPQKVSAENITIALTFTQPPKSFSLKHLGEELLSGTNSTHFDFRTTIASRFPPEGIDLVFEGTWPEHFRKVGVSIEVNRADGTKQTQTIWGAKEIFEVLTFPGKEKF